MLSGLLGWHFGKGDGVKCRLEQLKDARTATFATSSVHKWPFVLRATWIANLRALTVTKIMSPKPMPLTPTVCSSGTLVSENPWLSVLLGWGNGKGVPRSFARIAFQKGGK